MKIATVLIFWFCASLAMLPVIARFGAFLSACDEEAKRLMRDYVESKKKTTTKL